MLQQHPHKNHMEWTIFMKTFLHWIEYESQVHHLIISIIFSNCSLDPLAFYLLFQLSFNKWCINTDTHTFTPLLLNRSRGENVTWKWERQQQTTIILFDHILLLWFANLIPVVWYGLVCSWIRNEALKRSADKCAVEWARHLWESHQFNALGFSWPLPDWHEMCNGCFWEPLALTDKR